MNYDNMIIELRKVYDNDADVADALTRWRNLSKEEATKIVKDVPKNT